MESEDPLSGVFFLSDDNEIRQETCSFTLDMFQIDGHEFYAI